jgi:carboxylate-amine ligase
VDLETARAIPAREMIAKVLTFIRPALEEDGDWEEVAVLVRETLEHGNGASRQRRAYERAGRLEDVVDTLRETAPGGQVRQDRD